MNCLGCGLVGGDILTSGVPAEKNQAYISKWMTCRKTLEKVSLEKVFFLVLTIFHKPKIFIFFFFFTEGVLLLCKFLFGHWIFLTFSNSKLNASLNYLCETFQEFYTVFESHSTCEHNFSCLNNIRKVPTKETVGSFWMIQLKHQFDFTKLEVIYYS